MLSSWHQGSAPVHRARSRDQRSQRFALYRVGTVKPVALDGGASRLYVAVDGGMSDNIRTALYAAEYSATLASRRSTALRCWPGWSASTAKAATSWSGMSFFRRTLPRRPDRGARLGRVQPLHGEQLQLCPPTASHRSSDGQITTLIRRETIEDLLALDAG